MMTNEGIAYDAYTMERWWDSRRTDEMQAQTPGKMGDPNTKRTNLGTNLKQMVSGPDGNPSGQFTGSL